MKRINNSGMTLVEIVLALVILSMAGVMFTQCLTTTSRIIVRASMYKHASSTATSMIELQDPLEGDGYDSLKPKDTNINIIYKTNTDLDKETVSYIDNNNQQQSKALSKDAEGNPVITVSYSKAGAPSTFTMSGEIIKASDSGATNLSYREFLPGNYFFGDFTDINP